MFIRARFVPAFLVLSFTLVGCQHHPIIPAPGTDNTWQLITTYTAPTGQWKPVVPAMSIHLQDASTRRPQVQGGVFTVPGNQLFAIAFDSMRDCVPAAACQLVDFDHVYQGHGDSVIWLAQNHGPAVSYDLDVRTNAIRQEADTSIPRYWRAGENFEVDVNWAANSYRIEGVLKGVRVGFVVADSLHLSDSARKLVRLLKLTKLPDSGTVAQRNYTYLVLK